MYNGYIPTLAPVMAMTYSPPSPNHVMANNGAGSKGKLLHPGEGPGDFPVYFGDAVGEYRVQEFLGSGSFSKVLRCKHKVSGDIFAIKISKVGMGEEEEIQNELRMLGALAHLDPGCAYKWLPLVEHFQFAGFTCLVFPLCGASLFDDFEKRKFAPYDVEQIRSIARDLFTALAFIHGKGIIHGDVKPDNMLLRNKDDLSDIALVDFGSALYDWEEKRELGTVHYQSPEMMLGTDFSFKHDVFSAGLVLLELYCGRCLMGPDGNENTVLMQHLLGPIPVHLSGRRLPQSPGHAHACGIRPLHKFIRQEDGDFLDFLRQCLHYDPHLRTSAFDLLHHPFVGTGLVDAATGRRHSYNVATDRQSSLNSSNADSAPADLGSLEDVVLCETVTACKSLNTIDKITKIEENRSPTPDSPVKHTSNSTSSRNHIKPKMPTTKKDVPGEDHDGKRKSLSPTDAEQWATTVRKVASTPYHTFVTKTSNNTDCVDRKNEGSGIRKKSLAYNHTQPEFNPSKELAASSPSRPKPKKAKVETNSATSTAPKAVKADIEVSRTQPLVTPLSRTLSGTATTSVARIHPFTRRFFEGRHALDFPVVTRVSKATKTQSQTAVTPAVRNYVRSHVETNASPLPSVWRQRSDGTWMRGRRRNITQ
eukprot:TRINITY_DN1142_c0_g1_i2.p1 TRINITY_DN1142_c0_g1~~TRINITY_DN1142_c0_g1_i2.p1  ORF type:complete len:648 (-),score=73.02 TRINITY_DN1142_c0_g1_i2:422-2365(-)